MENLTTATNLQSWNELLRKRKKNKLLELLRDAPAVEVAEFLAKTKHSEIIWAILLQLPSEIFADIFIEFENDLQLELFQAWETKRFARVFSLIPSNHRADFYKILDKSQQARLLPYLTKKIRQDVITLSSYEPHTVGSCMSTDFATIMCDMDVQKAIQKLREDAPSKRMIYYLYVVDDNMKMMGFISLKDLVMNPPDEKITDLIHDNYTHANVNDDKEVVAQQIEKYDLLAIPILNDDKQLVGILRYDDAMDIIREEETEDMEKFMGIMSKGEDDYNSTSAFQHFKKRIVWIVGLFVSSFLSEFIIHRNESVLIKITALSLYLPMIIGAGGNAGSQAATVVIRALSLGHITIKNWVQIILKEAKVALLISVCLFLISFVKVMILASPRNGEPDQYNLALAISLALGIQVITSTIIGAALPIIAKYFKGDPAVAASPAISTLVDITGAIIYFVVTMSILL